MGHSSTIDDPGALAARLSVRLLGGCEVIIDGKRLRAFDSVRMQRFLASISLSAAPQLRSQIAYRLWPESSESQARTNLRKLLHDFRRALPDAGHFVEIDDATVRWLPAGPSEVDVLRFRSAMATGDFALASGIYSGDLLPACYDDWILDEREKLQSELLEVLARLVGEAAEREDHEAVVAIAQRILDLEPADETAVQLQMNSHLACGDRIAALRSYHRYADVLQREFGAVPGDSVRTKFRQLLAGPPDGDTVLTTRELPAESPFIGREHELSQLGNAWSGVQDGGSHFVLVTGEAGIGKSRLSVEFADHIRTPGREVVSARAYEAAGRLPWGPVVDLLRSDGIRSHIDTLDAAWKAELARLLPELTDTSTPVEPGPSAEFARRYRLFDAIARALGDGRPRLLIIDDLQWCDAETLELIGFVVRSLPDAPILIVGTARWEEVTEGHPLVALVDALARDDAVTTLPLERLDESATAALAAALQDDDAIDPTVQSRLWTETEGNPLFIVEALRAGVSSEDGTGVLTPTIRSVLHGRLGQLSEDARQLAEVAAAVGRPSSIELLAAVTDVSEPRLIELVDELWRRGIFRDRAAGYDFSHDLLRAVALEMISPARRRQLHGSIADAIERSAGEREDAVAAQLAAHYDQAGMVQQAIDAYRKAGAQAVSVSAPDEAITQFRRALSLLADLPISPDRDALELDLRIALGSPLVAAEGYGSANAHQLYERALSLCRKLRRPVDPPILRGLGLARLQGCDFTDCDRLARSLLEHESKDPVTTTEGRYLLGVSAFWQGDLASSRSFLNGAIESYDESRRDRHLAFYAQDPNAICRVRLAWTELWAGDVSRSDEFVRLALQRATDIEHDMTRAYVITYGALVAAESEDFLRLSELLDEGDRLWKRFSDRYLIVVLEALRSWLAVRDGATDGIDGLVEAAARSRSEGETLHLTYILLLLARARGVRGEIGQGLAATQEAIEWTQRTGQRYLESELQRVHGELNYRSGESQAAADSLYRSVDVARAQDARWLELRALNSLVSRFPSSSSRKRLAELVETTPANRELPPFRAAISLLSESD